MPNPFHDDIKIMKICRCRHSVNEFRVEIISNARLLFEAHKTQENKALEAIIVVVIVLLFFAVCSYSRQILLK